MPDSILTRADYLAFLQYLNTSESKDEDFLIRRYFGLGKAYLKLAIKRAYRDFNRTLHGFGALEERDKIRETAKNQLERAFQELWKYRSRVTKQAIFNAWHRSTCMKLISVYQPYHFHFYVGQAQKWVNMTLKYIFTLGESRLPGYQVVYPFCHVPLDNILIAALDNYGFPQLASAWSRIDDYAVYLGYQEWVRKCFTLAPLDTEFYLWSGRDIQNFSRQ